MRELDEVFAALAKSAFRCKFHLQGKFLLVRSKVKTTAFRRSDLSMIF
jgi:hypothetical protein